MPFCVRLTQINAKPKKNRIFANIDQGPPYEFPLHTTLKKAARSPLLGGLRYLCLSGDLPTARFQIEPAYLAPDHCAVCSARNDACRRKVLGLATAPGADGGPQPLAVVPTKAC